MNRTSIGWCTYSWNPVTGCRNHCVFKTPDGSESGCYAERITKRFPGHYPNGFEPTFYPTRLGAPARLKKPSKIFVCSMGELFAPWIPDEWIVQILEACRQASQHTYQFLTKFPHGYTGWIWDKNMWLGVTVTKPSDLWRAKIMKQITSRWRCGTRYISFEPLIADMELGAYDLEGIDWIILGGLTGPHAFKPPTKWIRKIEAQACRADCAVFMKANLGVDNPIQEWPEAPK